MADAASTAETKSISTCNANNAINISRRSAGMESFKVMDILQRANEIEQQIERLGHDDEQGDEEERDCAARRRLPILHGEVGQPETGAPQRVVQAAVDALTGTTTTTTTTTVPLQRRPKNVLGYTDAFGLVSLRTEIAHHYQRYYFHNLNDDNNCNNNETNNVSLSLSTDQIVVTTGSSGAFLLAFTACFDVGDVVAIASVGYPCYRNILSALGCTLVHVPVNAQFKLTAVELQAAIDQQKRTNNQSPRIKGLVLSSPSNPTGAMLTPQEMQDLCRLCDLHNIQFISDEIYHGISYGVVPEATAWQYSNRVICINSFSKYYSSTSFVPRSCRFFVSLIVSTRHVFFIQGSPLQLATPSSCRSIDCFFRQVLVKIHSLSSLFFVSTRYRPPSLFSLHTFTYYIVSGWRLGWMIIPTELIPAVTKLQQNMFINAPTISQTAACQCWHEETQLELQQHVQKYQVSRGIILEALQKLQPALTLAPAHGGFYVYVDLGPENVALLAESSSDHDNGDDDKDDQKADQDNDSNDLGSVAFCRALLEEYHVALTPGIDFEDPLTRLGNVRFRISYAGGIATAVEAMKRLHEFWPHWRHRVQLVKANKSKT
jgi:aspartate/methionine/tyrosine aminotransferase